MSKNTEMAQRAPLQGRTQEVKTSVKVQVGTPQGAGDVAELCSPSAP